MAKIVTLEDGKMGRSGEGYAQECAKTDGMSKGGATGMGSAPSMGEFYTPRGDGYVQRSAKTDGMCK